MDPENHKCAFAIVFNVHYEIQESEPVGLILGLVFGFIIEFLRQLEIKNRPKGKNALESNLGYDSLTRNNLES